MSSTVSAVDPAGFVTYTVQEGDQLGKILRAKGFRKLLPIAKSEAPLANAARSESKEAQKTSSPSVLDTEPQEEKVSESPQESPNYVTYTVQEHDQLAKILLARGFKKLWGKDGAVAKTFVLNIDRGVKDEGDLIFPQNIILLPIVDNPNPPEVATSETLENKGVNEATPPAVLDMEPQEDSAQETPNYVTYTVQEGDQLAEILLAHGFKNLWGKDGAVAKTFALNIDRDVEDEGELIFPDSVILLPIPDETDREVASEEGIENAEESDDDTERDFINVTLTPFYKYSLLQATDVSNSTLAYLPTLPLFGLKIGCEINLDDPWYLLADTQIESFSIMQPSNRTFTNGSTFLTAFSAGAGYHVMPALDAIALAKFEMLPFLSDPANGIINVDQIWAPGLALQGNWNFYTRDSIDLSLMGGLEILAPLSPANYSISEGLKQYGSIGFGTNYDEDYRFGSALRIEHFSTSTSLINEDIFSIGVEISISHGDKHWSWPW